ncbi:recombination mediator RecR [Candidatus Puniceispirillum sp.]|uniref:recombination mediator RecR n=1 Tax=Candidatus Puniceispirillum sp. TaxID=2026719 RepID=UPI001ED2CB1A|nr:recombination protein RecR [Candidatus Puniceispirillum sp.]
MDSSLENLIRRLGRLPGLGPRSARRAVLFLLKNRDRLMVPLARELHDIASTVRICVDCGNLDTADMCHICRDDRRDKSRICVVEDVGDLWAMERAAVFRGRYHVLGGTLSALDGRGPDDLTIDRLVRRAQNDDVIEVILALSATVDGQTTAHYIAEKLATSNLDVTRLAHGVPVGGELDYLDDGTLAQALKARAKMR